MAIHAEELRRHLAESLGRPVTLKINDNTHSMISCRRDGAGPGLRVSLHRMFLTADEAMIATVISFCQGPTAKTREKIRTFIHNNRELITKSQAVSRPRLIRGTAKGKAYDLGERARRLNASHFKGELDFRIIWGKNMRAGRGQRHVTLGTWNERQRIIRIHPMLDNRAVPWYFLEFIVYHEMCHIVIPSHVDCSGRMVHHSREFRALERRYPHFERSIAWEARWLPQLIRWWNGGAELPAEAQN